MTTIPTLTAADLFDSQHAVLELKWLAGRGGQKRPLEPPTAKHPGMALVGHLNPIHPNRVQVLGPSEVAHIDALGAQIREAQFATLFPPQSCAAIIIADDLPPPAGLVECSDTHGIPLFSSPLASPRLIDSLQYYLTHALAERVTLHGVLVEVLGMGILLTGRSGIGKSEIALELLSRNHRLVADDAVEIARIAPSVLEGRCPETLQGFLEVRGLGILNIRAMFGETAVEARRRLDLIVRFDEPNKQQLQEIDRLQAERRTYAVLGVDVPEVVLLVAPGRNLAVLVEAAARNHIQLLRGLNPLADFMSQQEEAIRTAVSSSSQPDPDTGK
jgi:HPr kinase/phosphorylase